MSVVPRGSMVLREASPADAPGIASLLAQLGYPATPAQATARLMALLGDPGRRICVAESEGAVVGLGVFESGLALNRDEPVARLALLVTDAAVRGQGIGRRLVEAFEDWARKRGARHVSLTSATHREQAHGFYRACGWEATGLRFARDLA